MDSHRKEKEMRWDLEKKIGGMRGGGIKSQIGWRNGREGNICLKRI
jgi:hypothetical protein